MATFGTHFGQSDNVPIQLVGAGSVSSPSVSTADDTNTGMYFSAADTVDFTTGGVRRFTIDSVGNVAIGGSGTTAGVSLSLSKDLTGATSAYGTFALATIKSDVTSAARGFSTALSTEAAAFTLSELAHFNAVQGTIGAGSTLTSQMGFRAASSLTGGTTNYGFYGDIAASGTARYNFYANGTAPNYFAGVCQFADGSNSLPSITNIGDLDTGIYFSAADQIDFTTGGARRAFITTTGTTIVGAFACNGATAQTAAASGGALAAYGAGVNGLDSGANMSALHALVVAMRAALVANGIMS